MGTDSELGKKERKKERKMETRRERFRIGKERMKNGDEKGFRIGEKEQPPQQHYIHANGNKNKQKTEGKKSFLLTVELLGFYHLFNQILFSINGLSFLLNRIFIKSISVLFPPQNVFWMRKDF